MTNMQRPGVPEFLVDELRPDPERGREINFQSPGERAPAVPKKTSWARWGGLLIGLVLSFAVFFALPGDVPHNARLTAAVAVLLAAWWMTEAIPIPATALVPLIVFPALSVSTTAADGTVSSISINQIGAPYGNSIIFLFLGGFLIALSMQRWNLHRRIALLVLKAMPSRPGAMVLGFMIAAGFMSMWVSNTATAVMMLPIGMSVLALVNQITGKDDEVALDTEGAKTVTRTKFGSALMLGSRHRRTRRPRAVHGARHPLRNWRVEQILLVDCLFASFRAIFGIEQEYLLNATFPDHRRDEPGTAAAVVE